MGPDYANSGAFEEKLIKGSISSWLEPGGWALSQEKCAALPSHFALACFHIVHDKTGERNDLAL